MFDIFDNQSNEVARSFEKEESVFNYFKEIADNRIAVIDDGFARYLKSIIYLDGNPMNWDKSEKIAEIWDYKILKDVN